MQMQRFAIHATRNEKTKKTNVMPDFPAGVTDADSFFTIVAREPKQKRDVESLLCGVAHVFGVKHMTCPPEWKFKILRALYEENKAVVLANSFCHKIFNLFSSFFIGEVQAEIDKKVVSIAVANQMYEEFAKYRLINVAHDFHNPVSKTFNWSREIGDKRVLGDPDTLRQFYVDTCTESTEPLAMFTEHYVKPEQRMVFAWVKTDETKKKILSNSWIVKVEIESPGLMARTLSEDPQAYIPIFGITVSSKIGSPRDYSTYSKKTVRYSAKAENVGGCISIPNLNAMVGEDAPLAMKVQELFQKLFSLDKIKDRVVNAIVADVEHNLASDKKSAAYDEAVIAAKAEIERAELDKIAPWKIVFPKVERLEKAREGSKIEIVFECKNSNQAVQWCSTENPDTPWKIGGIGHWRGVSMPYWLTTAELIDFLTVLGQVQKRLDRSIVQTTND